MANLDPSERAARVRQARQVLAGNEIAPPEEASNPGGRLSLGGSAELRYLLGVAVLIVVAAVVWATAGMGVMATIVFLVLAVALLFGWFIL